MSRMSQLAEMFPELFRKKEEPKPKKGAPQCTGQADSYRRHRKQYTQHTGYVAINGERWMVYKCPICGRKQMKIYTGKHLRKHGFRF